jgi:hypothetical protein
VNDNPTELEAELEATAPGFLRAVHAPGADMIIMSILGFADEPELFFKCVTYATEHGQDVSIPASERAPRA